MKMVEKRVEERFGRVPGATTPIEPRMRDLNASQMVPRASRV